MLNSFFLLQTFLERINHNLRNKISVATAVISDLSDGYEIGPEEIDDSKKALEDAVELLRFFEPIIKLREIKKEEINIIRFLTGFFYQNDLELDNQVGNYNLILSSDSRVLNISLNYILSYLKSKKLTEAKFNFSLVADGNSLILKIQIVDFLNLKVERIEDFSSSDLSIEALGIVFSNEILELYKLGKMEMKISQNVFDLKLLLC